MMPRYDGRVTGLQVSAGGVPKRSIARAVVHRTGMEGDRQAHRKFHGGPERALCLYSQERLDALAAEGHPVEPGSLGENVTIAGVPWEQVRPGVRLSLGGVEVEVTGYAVPCRSIAHAFADGRMMRVGEKSNPGWSRVYVRILSEGLIAVGDAAILHD
jgi:MOSC domain-containing protein YiiM